MAVLSFTMSLMSTLTTLLQLDDQLTAVLAIRPANLFGDRHGTSARGIIEPISVSSQMQCRQGSAASQSRPAITSAWRIRLSLR
jgi:hypothetical protein